MKTITYSELKSDVKDRFSYILVFCPNFPPATGATTKTAFEKLIGSIDAITQQTKNEEAKQWLRLCLQEVRASWKSYEEGDIHKGAKQIQQARRYFSNALSKKPMEPRFIAGESGAALDDQSGFPN
jgi:hypothetical protein